MDIIYSIIIMKRKNFINKGKNISFSEQVNYAIDKLLKKDVNVELDTTADELRKRIN